SLAKYGFRFGRLPISQQRCAERLPNRVEPGWRLLVRQCRFQLYCAAPMLNGLVFLTSGPGNLRLASCGSSFEEIVSFVIDQEASVRRKCVAKIIKLPALFIGVGHIALSREGHCARVMPESGMKFPVGIGFWRLKNFAPAMESQVDKERAQRKSLQHL